MQVSDGIDGVPSAMKPNVVEAPAPSVPFQATFFTVAAEPLVVSVPFQTPRCR
ncbi:hypothetical protein Prum_013600 [Phytohabitans rumicis]|uniref:Uncharacterized protein n=1 Tax=Phytohabitans rumicis TaxID=1076125 RepID=A0A6V8KYF8_9ACTN|nr:hypothetical protein Prum_013600 [Phytohabitans rumicis]